MRYKWMRCTWALLILLLVAPLTAQTPKEKKGAKPPATTMTGCVDEKSSEYVLFTDDMLKEIAKLESVGFERTNFARFVGHKVSITGQLIGSTQPTPTLRVTNYDNIKIIADICAPADGK
jgi:hypothetical protein